MYGIIGYPLSHSFSPDYFREKFLRLGIDEIYSPFPIESVNAFRQLLKDQPDLKGLNVTIPYKQEILQFLDEIDDTAAAVGAVNCIKIDNNRTKGFNTDVAGFRNTLEPLLQPHHRQALVLGTGGAAKAVCYALHQLNIPYQIVSRTESPTRYNYKSVDKSTLENHLLVINTTPLGMFPNVYSCPEIPYENIGSGHLLYDLIYNPAETLFLKKGKMHGAAIQNGYSMLIAQAEASWDIWNSYSL